MVDEPTESKRERREAARQERIEAARRHSRSRRRRKLLIVGTAVVVAVALVVVGLDWYRGRDEKRNAAVTAARAAAGCDGIKEQPDAGAAHIDDTSERRPYSSKPPTSGDHIGNTALLPIPGFQAQSYQPEIYVHNLEHGQSWVHYKPDLPQEQIDELRAFVEGHSGPGGAVNAMANPDIDAPVVITAWRHMEQCQEVSVPVLENFVRERCNKTGEPLVQFCI
ncbi:MAG: DUF3105 domain-containing protein [Actinomycetota bacterium]